MPSRFVPTLRRMWPELKKAVPVVLCLSGIDEAWATGRAATTDTSDAIRYAGTLLHFFGIVLVAYGLHDLRKSFAQPSLLSEIRAWFQAIRAALKPPDTGIVIGAGVLSASGVVSRAFVSGTGNTVEQRLSRLEEQLVSLTGELHRRDTRLTQELADVRSELASEAQERRTATERAEAKMKDLAVGGLHLEMVGLVWLLFATIASSIPDEIALWLS